MNERIKELAVEAFQPINDMSTEGVADYYTFNQPWFQLYNQKFAELIVRECAITVIDRCEMRNAEDIKRAEYHANRIKQHFGVEL